MSTLDEKIRVGADQLKLTLSQGQISQLVRYAALIQKWNRATRLVGDEGDDALALQILDSLAILRLSLPEAACLDIGSGAGLPGIPLAIVRADIPIELLEPRERRASFLSEAKRLLNLANVTIVCDRLEKRSYSADTLAMAKAVAPPPRLLQMADQAGLKQVVVMANQKTEASAAGNGWTALERDIVPLRFKPEHVNILLRKDEPT